MKQYFTVTFQIAPDKLQVSSTIFTVLTMKWSCLSNMPFNSYILHLQDIFQLLCLFICRVPTIWTELLHRRCKILNTLKDFKGLFLRIWKKIVLWRTIGRGYWEVLGFVAVGGFFKSACSCLFTCPFLFLKIMIPTLSFSHWITHCARYSIMQES